MHSFEQGHILLNDQSRKLTLMATTLESDASDRGVSQLGDALEFTAVDNAAGDYTVVMKKDKFGPIMTVYKVEAFEEDAVTPLTVTQTLVDNEVTITVTGATGRVKLMVAYERLI